ncbi:MAG: FecR domain-containing protein [Polyangiales bacterium]
MPMTPQEILEATLRQAERETVADLEESDARAMARRAIAAAQVKKQPRAFGALAVAAVALLCVLGGFAVATWSQPAAPAFVQKLEASEPIQEGEGLSPEEALALADAENAASAEASADVRLPTGDRLLSTSGTHYDVVSADPDRVVALSEGDVLFDIEPVAGGSFVVSAGATEVRVLGTVFSVRRTDEGVAVLVYEGRVMVTNSDGERVLGAGEFWASSHSLVDDAWRETSEARWNALMRETGAQLAPPPVVREGSSGPGEPEPGEEQASPAEGTSEPPEAEEVRSLLLRREYREVLVAAQAELNDDPRSAEWATIVADAYRGLQDWPAAAPAYRAASALARTSRRAQLGYAAAQIYAERLSRPQVALEVLAAARSANTGSIVEERARSLQIRLLRQTHQSAALVEAVDAYLERFPDTHTAVRLRAEH